MRPKDRAKGLSKKPIFEFTEYEMLLLNSAPEMYRLLSNAFVESTVQGSVSKKTLEDMGEVISPLGQAWQKVHDDALIRASKSSGQADKATCGADKATCGADKATCGADKATCGADKPLNSAKKTASGPINPLWPKEKASGQAYKSPKKTASGADNPNNPINRTEKASGQAINPKKRNQKRPQIARGDKK